MNEHQHQCGKHSLSLWYCEGCRQIHLKAGAVSLNFTKEEFAALTNAVVEIYCEQISDWKLLDHVENMLARRDDGDNILLSETVA